MKLTGTNAVTLALLALVASPLAASEYLALRFLPAKEPALYCQLDEDWLFAVQELREVRRDGTVSYRNIGYGVPAEYTGDHVWLHLVDSKVVITHAGKTIAEHPLTV